MLEKEYIITLEDGEEYYVVSTTMYNNEKYAYLMNMKQDNYYVFAKELNTNEGIKVEAVLDQETIQKILPYLQLEIV